MSDYKPVPVLAAFELSRTYGKSMVLILAYDPDHDKLHFTTYGTKPREKEFIADVGDKVAKFLSGAEKFESFEDFRFVDQAKRATQIRQLREIVGQFVKLWDDTWDSTKNQHVHEWTGLYCRANEALEAEEV